MKLLVLSSLVFPIVIMAGNLKPASINNEGKAIEYVSPKTACSELPGFISRKWMMEEIRFLQDNQPYYYRRGERRESNMNFDNDWIVFNCDGKGIYHEGNGIEYSLQWQLVEGKNITLEYTISKFRQNSDLKVKLEDIILDQERITYTEYYTHKNKTHSLGIVKRIAEAETEQLVANR
jgi:hypothetical protein